MICCNCMHKEIFSNANRHFVFDFEIFRAAKHVRSVVQEKLVSEANLEIYMQANLDDHLRIFSNQQKETIVKISRILAILISGESWQSTIIPDSRAAGDVAQKVADTVCLNCVPMEQVAHLRSTEL